MGTVPILSLLWSLFTRGICLPRSFAKARALRPRTHVYFGEVRMKNFSTLFAQLVFNGIKYFRKLGFAFYRAEGTGVKVPEINAGDKAFVNAAYLHDAIN